MKLVSVVAIVTLVFAPYLSASTIRVPQDQPTIQGGIDAAQNGDVVLVSPGVYNENIDFLGKAITVRSAKGSLNTIIDGGGTYQTVSFHTGETSSSVLEGFTIRNGFCAFTEYSAGGISIGDSSPTIKKNVVTKNFGVGIAVYSAAPLITQNRIVKNISSPDAYYCGPAQGSGILVSGPPSQGTLQIIGNEISHNIANADGSGAGIYLWIPGAPLIENNLIEFNQAGASATGGGITMQNSGSPVIVQNLIVGNTAGQAGGGLDLEIPNDGSSATVVNNTIVGNHTGTENQGETGPGVYIAGFYGTVTFWNNIIDGYNQNAVVYCDPSSHAPSPSFFNNDAFSPIGSDYAGACAGTTGKNGNISADPKFVDKAKANYELQKNSPAVNAGSNSAPDLPAEDLAGNSRIVGGIIDIGAYEYQGK